MPSRHGGDSATFWALHDLTISAFLSTVIEALTTLRSFPMNPVNRIKSKNDEVSKSVIPDGITLLFDEYYNPISEMNLFILKATDKRGLQNTSNSYADDLANWEMFCHYHHVDRLKASRADIEFYHSILEGGISAKTHKKFAQTTISRRLGTVKSFYRFCVAERFAADSWDSPYRYSGKIVGRKKGNKTRFIDTSSLARILDALGPSLSDTEVSPTRDRTVAEFLFSIGGRLEDAADLKLTDVLNWNLEFEHAPHKLLIEHKLSGKNGERTVLILRPMAKAVMRYVQTTRAEIIGETLLKKERGWRAPNRVFLNSIDANNRDLGGAASRDTLGRAFVEGVKKAKLLIFEERVVYGPDGEPIFHRGEFQTEQVLRPKHTAHHLRHTFVAVLAEALHRHGNKAPFKVVQALLGHAWLSTTVDTYATPLAYNEPGITDAYLAVLRGLDFHGDEK